MRHIVFVIALAFGCTAALAREIQGVVQREAREAREEGRGEGGGASAGAASSSSEGVLLATPSAHGYLRVKSWKTLRDERIVKQNLDYSCGAASMATLLNGFYGQNVTEKALLDAMDKGDGRASFDDMARVLPSFGFRGQGFAASWEQLVRLKIPVIVYLKHRRDDHFSVLRGIDGNTVWLADPSLGNRTYSKAQFLEMWRTRLDKIDTELAGKFLAVLPIKESAMPERFFTKFPVRQSSGAVAQLAFRPLY